MLKYNKNGIFSSVKRKILFIITQSEFGGAQRFLSTLVPKLDPQNYDVLVATGSTGDKHFTDHLNNLKIPNTTLRHLVRNPHVWHDFKAVFEIRKLISNYKPDTVFLLSTKAGWLGSLAISYKLKAKSCKVIYRIGGWAFNDPQSSLRRRIIIWAERISARWKDTIIVNNRHDFEQAKQFGITPRKHLLLIHNGLDVAKMKFLPREEARKKLGLAQDDFVAGTIAHDYPSKGLKYLPGRQAGRPKALEYRQVVLSNVKNASRYMKAFDVYVSPSVKEGFSWAVLEAMSAGIPVIATNVGAAPEMIDDGENGFLVEPKHPDQIADRIRTLMGNESLRNKFSTQSLQTVSQKFDLETMVRKVVELL